MLFTASKLAKEVGVNVTTVRYYIKEGLLKPVETSESNYNIFNKSSVQRLKTILELKEQNYSLDEIKELLNDIGGV